MKSIALVMLVLAGCMTSSEGEVVQTEAVSDPIQACPVPDVNDIPGHEAEFYLCAEQTAQCGPNGYLLGYGAKYAERFYTQTRPKMTARGQQWIDDVLVCLQTELRASIDAETSCDDIRTIAFDTHPACYVENGFCTLSVWDIAQVVWTIDTKDLLGAAAAKQIVTTAIDCGDEYAAWARGLFWYLL